MWLRNIHSGIPTVIEWKSVGCCQSSVSITLSLLLSVPASNPSRVSVDTGTVTKPPADPVTWSGVRLIKAAYTETLKEAFLRRDSKRSVSRCVLQLVLKCFIAVYTLVAAHCPPGPDLVESLVLVPQHYPSAHCAPTLPIS